MSEETVGGTSLPPTVTLTLKEATMGKIKLIVHEFFQACKSISIETQKMMLEDLCHQRGFPIHVIYADDGYSRLNFNCSAFSMILEDIDSGKVNLVITKDLSRLGRDYIQIGYYTDMYFSRKRVW